MRSSVVLTAVLLTSVCIAAGCGGSTTGDGGPSDTRPKRGHAPSTQVIAALGDSINAGSPSWDPDPQVRAQFAHVDEDSQWERWVDTDATLRNCGVWGERTDEIAHRYGVCTKGASAVVVQGGINDIVQGRPIDAAAHDLTCMVERAIDDDKQVAIANVLPWNNGDAAAATQITQLNREIQAIGTAHGIPVLPFYATLSDPADPTHMPTDLTVEGNHPTAAGYRLLGERAWRVPLEGHTTTPEPGCS